MSLKWKESRYLEKENKRIWSDTGIDFVATVTTET
jgi:hypothetical protein